MPLPIFPIVWLGKYLVFPLVDTIREFKHRRKIRKDGKDVEVEVPIWIHPHASVSSPRLYKKVTTNTVEQLVHASGLARFMYGWCARRFCHAYQTWSPPHDHEHELYRRVQDLKWPLVVRLTFRWFKTSVFHRFENTRRKVPLIENLSKRGGRWRRIRFDGMVIAACVPRTKGLSQEPFQREFSRKDSKRLLRLIFPGNSAIEVMAVVDGQITRRFIVTETEIKEAPTEV